MSDDLISRKEAIDAAMNDDLIVNAMDSVKDGDMHRTKRAIARLLTSLPSAQLWIPVTERLPKLGEKVLVSTKHTVFTQVFKCIYGTPDMWGWEHNTIKKVIAWMPLPEPYKEDKNDATIH